MAGTPSTRVARDPLECEEFAYGLGAPTGILLLRYRTGEAATLGSIRDDFLHQVYWCRDGRLRVAGPDGEQLTLGPDQAYWARRAVSHQVLAVDGTLVYRALIREVPPGLVGMRHGAAAVTGDARRQLVRLGSPGMADDGWATARARLLRGLHQARADARRSTSAAELVAAVLRSDPSTERSLAEFARQHHVSVKTLQRDFVRTFGCSFSRWRTRTRLAAAHDLIGAVSVAEVAYRVGYSSTSAFVAAFRREYGCTPGRLSHD